MIPAQNMALATTGPSAAHSSETACGARSHKAPLSRRHGVLNGLDTSNDDPSQNAHPPAHRHGW